MVDGGGMWLNSLKFLSKLYYFCVSQETFVSQIFTLLYPCEWLPFSSKVSDPYPILLSSR